MTRTVRSTTSTTASRKPSLMARLRHPRAAKVTKSESTNPITGTRTTTKKTKTHPKGVGHHGHGGNGPLSTEPVGTTATGHTRAPTHRHERKPSVGDKVSGAMMKLKGSLTGKPGLKAAGTRRMHGTDGRGTHSTY
ncbi:hypothetical protein LTR36_005025 [Oleoguttula mirabilis]|uniref:Uncharacterized protein n=1 Tax=Oleoguttula mirabilis TaxID=1507867 RepID=A0AAV9JW05_9PEZI|nr:hypothetical protein LTR36_005025 [Oleoguttula mirabilis]